MIVADTNIFSTFACVNRLDLLFQVGAAEILYLPPGVLSELETGLACGNAYLQTLIDEIRKGDAYHLQALSADETNFLNTLPKALHAGKKKASPCVHLATMRPFLPMTGERFVIA